MQILLILCEDMDECELEDIGQTCAGTCINTIGSFRCSEEDGAEEDGAEDEGEDEREAEAIREAMPSSSTQTSTTTTSTTTPATTTITTSATTTSTAAAPTTTTAATTTSTTIRPEERVVETVTTEAVTPVSPIPADEIEEEEEGEGPEEEGEEIEGDEGEAEEGAESEDKEHRIDNNLAPVVEAKETHSEPEETCPDGFLLADRLAESEDGSACQDVDECASEDKFGCSHLCVNTQGSAHCDCPSGWNLNDDHKTCRGIKSIVDQLPVSTFVNRKEMAAANFRYRRVRNQ